MHINEEKLLYRAARAAHIKIHRIIKADVELDSPLRLLARDDTGIYTWNPIHNRDHALSLACTLRMNIMVTETYVCACAAGKYKLSCCETITNEYPADIAVCMAIVRVASAMYELT